MGAVQLRIEGGIAFIEFDKPNSKVNVLDSGSMRELAGYIDEIAGNADIRALLITSKKEGIFIAGADIGEIQGITSSEEARKKAEDGKKILQSLEDLQIVSVAVINGACLGGGFELALACKYRVGSFSDRLRMGLPEVKLGIIPGFGGTQRLPRLAGLSRALDMILSGRMLSGKSALKYGLMDRMFPDATLAEDVVNFAEGVSSGKEKVPRKKKKKVLQLFLENTPLGRALLFKGATKNVMKLTKGFYPAPLKAIEVLRRTYGRSVKKGFTVESEAFGELALTEVSRNLIRVFYLFEEFKKFPWVEGSVKPASVRKCGVLGAGVMGGGIAQLVSFNDIPVRMKDIDHGPVKTALKTAYGLFTYAMKKRKLKRHQVDYKFGLISPTLSYAGFENADIIIEAVVENLGVKRKVFEEVSRIAPAEAVLASNTSALPILKIGEAAVSPERVCGMHFFNPVHRMPLIEVIRSEKTGERALATVVAFARKLGKTVIVVKDVPGFLINRILLSYLNEAGYLLEEGMKMDRIDAIARRFGMPMGPIELIDEVGIDVGSKVVKILEEAYGPRMLSCAILEKLKTEGLLGKKAKKGFYIHEAKKKTPNPRAYQLLAPFADQAPSDDIALKRMIYVMVNEAARCLEEGVVERPETIDIGMITGTGFPPFRAGLLRYADSVGPAAIERDLKEFEKKYNVPRFTSCGYLSDRAKRKETFYPAA